MSARRRTPWLALDAEVSVGVDKGSGVWNLWVGSEVSGAVIEFECEETTLRRILVDAIKHIDALKRHRQIARKAGKAGGRGRKKESAHAGISEVSKKK